MEIFLDIIYHQPFSKAWYVDMYFSLVKIDSDNARTKGHILGRKFWQINGFVKFSQNSLEWKNLITLLITQLSLSATHSLNIYKNNSENETDISSSLS